ncbi:MAG: GGDEF domain-containing protein [Clostridia bacterium]|nr:GGDEF domain-containing protein [Clostridia bacterium]NCC44265.1 GGDEF domain-containing protein [Clostridia bacterium]
MIRCIFAALFSVEILFFLFYLLVVLRLVNNLSNKENQLLKRTQDQLAVQQILFDAYKNPKCIEQALEVTSSILQAESAFLFSLNAQTIQEVRVCPDHCSDKVKQLTNSNIESSFPQISRHLFQNESLLLYNDIAPNDLCLAEIQSVKGADVSSLMIVPVFDSDHRLSALLGAVNMAYRWDNTDFLEDIARDFMMALNSVTSYRLIQRMGSIDSLTGLHNRNSYQQFISLPLSYLPSSSSCLGCIYIDVNGLHELNNHLGHSAGDKMLKNIGHIITQNYVNDHKYRIGGDEFVIFSTDPQEILEDKIAHFISQINEADYNVSVGLSWSDSPWELDKLIKDAEHKMYQAKHQYYQEQGDVKKSRDMNRKLEQILQEKKDADTFLSIISPSFMGVYVVDLDTDKTRIIYQPSYFTEMLKETDYRFLEALRNYVNTFVIPAERSKFLQFLNYDSINEALKGGNMVEYHYCKTDGSRLFMRICQSLDYGADNKEAFWIFEKYSM